MSILIFISFIISFKFWTSRIELIIHAQIILFLIFANENTEKNLINFSSNFQWTKFDFGFIITNNFKRIINCSSSTEKLKNIQFYWDEMPFNYICIIIIALVVILIKFTKKLLPFLNKLWWVKRCRLNHDNSYWLKRLTNSLNSNLSWNLLNNISKYFTNKEFYLFWTALIIWPFLILSLTIDLLSYEKHFFISLISIAFWVVFAFCYIVKYITSLY